MNKRHAYVEVIFDKEASDYFSGIVSEIVNKDELYYSPIVERIQGDVTDGLHSTLFFGLDESEFDNPELKKYLEGVTIDKIKLGKLMLFRGYQGLYRILNIEVLDEDNKLFEIFERLKLFKYNPEVIHYEFKPHITLAYVKPSYTIPTNIPEINKELEPKEIRISIER